MPLTLSQTVSPVEEPVSLEEVKSYIHIDHFEDETLLQSLIKTAREYIELSLRRQFLTATFVLAFDEFPRSRIVQLPRPPLQSITSIIYLDSNNVSTTLASSQYDKDTLSEPGRVYLLPSNSWPSTYNVPNAVKITYVAGWTSKGLIPESLISLICLFVAHLYKNPLENIVEDSIRDLPLAFEMLLNNNRVIDFF